jgi:hypothetical protein
MPGDVDPVAVGEEEETDVAVADKEETDVAVADKEETNVVVAEKEETKDPFEGTYERAIVCDARWEVDVGNDVIG